MCSINNAILLSTVALSLCVASITCLPFGNSRIIFGEKAATGQFPYQVLLRQNGCYICGGSIISERFVLTAGHCIGKGNVEYPEDFQVTVNAHNRTDGQTYEVKKLFLHENFTMERYYNRFTGIDNDIALIELMIPIQFSENVAPIKLNRKIIPENVTVVMSGYGTTERSKLVSALNYLYLNTQRTCNENEIHSNSALCAISVIKYGGICTGDSGGPLAYNNSLVGIHSWGPKRCERNVPNGFTRVSLFVDWVEKIMRNAVKN